MPTERRHSETSLWTKSDERDFLRAGAHTPLWGEFQAAGIPFTLSTNFEPLLRIAQECMEPRPGAADGSAQVHLRFWVEPCGHSQPPWPKPHFRGHGHLIFAGFDTRNSLLFYLRNCRVLGRLTAELAADATFWKVVVFPVLLSIMGSAMGRAVLHCACLVWKGTGILLAGDS